MFKLEKGGLTLGKMAVNVMRSAGLLFSIVRGSRVSNDDSGYEVLGINPV